MSFNLCLFNPFYINTHEHIVSNLYETMTKIQTLKEKINKEEESIQRNYILLERGFQVIAKHNV